MCTPIALGVAAIAGGVMSGVGSYQSHMTNAANYAMQAQGLERDIAAERETTAYTVARTREDVQRTLGSARAGYAANGLALSGSAAEVLNETALEGELDIAAIRWNSETKVDSMKYQQKIAKANAKAEKSAAPIAFFSNVFSAAGNANFG